MRAWSGTLGAAALAAICLASGCSDDSGKTVAGRTRSVSSVESATGTAEASVELRRTREQATRAEVVVVAARLTGSDAEEAVLRFPDGTEEPLEADAAGAHTTTLRIPAGAPVAELSGAYTFLWFDALGSRRSVSVIASGAFPPYPELTAPQEHALVDAAATHLEWSWGGTAGLFEVSVSDAPPATAVLRYAASGLTGSSHDVQGLPVGRRLRIELGVGDVPLGRPARWVSATALDVDTLQ